MIKSMIFAQGTTICFLDLDKVSELCMAPILPIWLDSEQRKISLQRCISYMHLLILYLVMGKMQLKQYA